MQVMISEHAIITALGKERIFPFSSQEPLPSEDAYLTARNDICSKLDIPSLKGIIKLIPITYQHPRVISVPRGNEFSDKLFLDH